MAIEINAPFDLFTDANGAPLNGGKIYIGTAGLNPETNPINVYWDAAFTTPAVNPAATSAGLIYRNGTPSKLYCNAANYSITVKDSNGILIYSNLYNTGSTNTYAIADFASLDPSKTGSNTIIIDDIDRGGIFTWSATGTADGGTVFAGVTGYWHRQYDGDINAKWFGVKGDGVTDDTALIQVAVTAIAGKSIFFPSGTYLTTTATLVSSGTVVKGVKGSTIFKASATYTGVDRADGAIFRNLNFYAVALTDHDITFDGLTFDYTARVTGGQQVGTFARFATNVKTINCTQYSGGDLSAFLYCKDTETSSNTAYDVKNCAYDHWSSSGNIIVTNNVTRSSTVSSSQSIQITGDNTDPITAALLNSGECDNIVIANNIIDIPSNGTNSGIILNNLTVIPKVRKSIISNNIVKGTTYGIALEGRVEETTINSNIIDSATVAGVLVFTLFPADPTTFPYSFGVNNNIFVNCSTAGTHVIDAQYCSYGTISHNQIRGSGHAYGINLRANSSFCNVIGNSIDVGTTGKILNSGTSNITVSPESMQSKYSNTIVFSAAAAPTTWTVLNVSSVVGANRAVCRLRVANASGSTATYVFRRNGDTAVESTLASIGTGVNICTMQNAEAQYVSVITDASGILEWVSTIGTGTSQVILESFQILY